MEIVASMLIGILWALMLPRDEGYGVFILRFVVLYSITLSWGMLLGGQTFIR